MRDSGSVPKTLIGFEGLRFACIIGVLPHERVTEQELIIDLKVAHRADKDQLSDDTDPRIDYTVLAELTIAEAQKGQYRLIETLASRILHAVHEKYSVSWAWIRLRKPGAIPQSAGAILEFEQYFAEEQS